MLHFQAWADYLGLTQSAISARTAEQGHFVPPASVQKMFAGTRNPRVSTAETVAAAMGLTLGDLESPPPGPRQTGA